MKAEISISRADNTDELLRGLEEIYFYYQYRQDTYVPPNYTTLRLNEISMNNRDLEYFRPTATVLVKPSQVREILNRKDEFEEKVAMINTSLSGLSDKKASEILSVNEEYEKSVNKMLTDARLKGSGYSNSLNNEVALLEAKKSEKIVEINAKYLHLEDELLAKKAYYENQISSAETYFLEAHNCDVEKKMQELYDNYEVSKIETFKYNNSLIEKVTKYNNSLTQAIEKTRLDFMEIKQIELTQEQLMQAGYFNDALEWVITYYYDEFDNPVDAYNDFISYEEFIVYLKYTYDNVLDLLYTRAYGASVSQ